jgi:predicted O-methyltransferase YrrM
MCDVGTLTRGIGPQSYAFARSNAASSAACADGESVVPNDAAERLWTDVDTYFADKLLGYDDGLAAALANNEINGLPAIDVSPAQGRLLHLLVKMARPLNVLEIGTLGGYSTICMASALERSATLTTLELSEKHASVARENFKMAKVADRIKLIVGDARQSLEDLADELDSSVDFIFLDADKSGYPEYYEWMLDLSSHGAIWVVDNVVRNGAIIEHASHDPNVQGVRAFTDLVAENEYLTATTIQTVGTKGYDGFMLVRVRHHLPGRKGSR